MPRLLALFAVALAVVLTGCRVEVRAEVAVRDDGTGEVALTVVTDREVLQQAPGLAEDLSVTDAVEAGWAVDGPRQTPDGGLIVVLRKPFATVAEGQAILAELSGPAGPLHDLRLDQARSFARLTTTFDGEGRVDGGLAAFGDADLVQALGGRQPFEEAVGGRPLPEVLGITLTLLLPGEVTSSSPAAEVAADASAASYRIPVDGTSVSLATTAVLEDAEALAARQRERLAMAGLVAWVAVVLVGGTFWLVRRRRRAEAGGRPGPPAGRGDGPRHPNPVAPPS